MANFSDKADEVVGKAKQAAGDLTGNDELRAEGTAEKATAQVKQGVDAAIDKTEEIAADVKESVSDTVDKASKQASDLADKASDTAEQLHLDDKRVLVVAAIAGITLTVLVRKFRGNRGESRGKTVTKRAAKRATKTGLARALSN